MSRYLKSAFFSALLVWAVAFPVLGLKLSIVGINLEVHGTGPVTLTIIALCSVLMFLRVLFTQQIGTWFKSSRGPLVSPKVSQFLTLPRTQRYIIIGLIIAALIWPFFGSRGAVVGLDRYGASAPGEQVLARLGFTVEHVVACAKELLP